MAKIELLGDNTTLHDLELKQSEDPKILVVFVFTASWCAPCKILKNAIVDKKFKAKFERIKFYSIDIDKCAKLAVSCGIAVVPTIQIREGPAIIDKIGGADTNALQKLISDNLTRLDFMNARQNVSLLNPTPDELLRLYGLLQQGSGIPCVAKAPHLMNAVEAAKYNAWKGFSSLSKVDAQKEYSDFVEALLENRKQADNVKCFEAF